MLLKQSISLSTRIGTSIIILGEMGVGKTGVGEMASYITNMTQLSLKMSVDRPIVQLQEVTRRNMKCKYQNTSENTHLGHSKCESRNLHIKIPYIRR